MDNSWLKASISKNYHHFFPRAYLRDKGLPNWQINTILNITIVDDHMNKREIRANPPAKYMETFKKSNKKLDETMKSHLINDLDTFGIWDNDYEKFLEARGKHVIDELNQQLKIQISTSNPCSLKRNPPPPKLSTPVNSHRHADKLANITTMD